MRVWVGTARPAYQLLTEQGLEPIWLIGLLNPLDAQSNGCKDCRRTAESVSTFQTLIKQQPQPPSPAVNAASCIAFHIVQEQTSALRPCTC